MKRTVLIGLGTFCGLLLLAAIMTEFTIFAVRGGRGTWCAPNDYSCAIQSATP